MQLVFEMHVVGKVLCHCVFIAEACYKDFLNNAFGMDDDGGPGWGLDEMGKDARDNFKNMSFSGRKSFTAFCKHMQTNFESGPTIVTDACFSFLLVGAILE